MGNRQCTCDDKILDYMSLIVLTTPSSSFAEKDEFKKFIQSKSKGSFGQELNFKEAYDNSYKAYALPSVCRLHNVYTI